MRRFAATAWLALIGLLFCVGPARAGESKGSIIVSEGFSEPNGYAGALPDFFEDWCDGGCGATGQLAVYDVKKGRGRAG